MQENNNNEIETEARIAFAEQEYSKELKWLAKKQGFPSKRASWEVYWKAH